MHPTDKTSSSCLLCAASSDSEKKALTTCCMGHKCLLCLVICFHLIPASLSQERDCVPGTRSPCFLTSALFITPGAWKSFRSPSPSQEPSRIRHPLFVPIHLAARSLGKVRSCLVNVSERKSGQLGEFHQGAISKIQLGRLSRQSALSPFEPCCQTPAKMLHVFMSSSHILWLQHFSLALPLDTVHKLLRIPLYPCLRGRGEEC